jgi:hypothetical protein
MKQAKAGYIYRGSSGWSVAWWVGDGEARYIHGAPTQDVAFALLCKGWQSPPLAQDGFPTQVFDERLG